MMVVCFLSCIPNMVQISRMRATPIWFRRLTDVTPELWALGLQRGARGKVRCARHHWTLSLCMRPLDCRLVIVKCLFDTFQFWVFFFFGGGQAALNGKFSTIPSDTFWWYTDSRVAINKIGWKSAVESWQNNWKYPLVLVTKNGWAELVWSLSCCLR